MSLPASTLAASDLQVQIENALRAELEANGFLLQRVDLGEVVYPDGSLATEKP